MKKCILAALVLMLAAACEKPIIGDFSETTDETSDKVRLSLTASTSSSLPFNSASSAPRRAAEVANACTRLSFAVYKDGERVVSKNQTSADSDFGSCDIELEKGTYRIVVVGHSGEKSATTTDPYKITFNGKVTDTFWYTKEINLTENTDLNVQLQRVVAMVRLIVTDAIPDEVTQMKFYYTGGSSTLDGTTGYGCVNSKQTELRAVTDDMRSGDAVFEVYTMPHAQTGTLNMTVSALDANGNTVRENVFSEVSVTMNRIMQLKGEFFTQSPDEGRGKIFVTVDDAWSGTDEQNY